MTAVFYTAVVIATLYSLFSLLGWYATIIAYQTMRNTVIEYNKRNRFKKAPMPTISFHWYYVILDIVVVVYWIWMIVRCFVG